MLGRSGGGAEGLLQERHADALGPAHLLQGRQRPGPALHHLGEQSQADANHLALLGQPENGLPEEELLVPGYFARIRAGNSANARPNAASTFSAWPAGKRSTAREFSPFHQTDVQVMQEPGDGHPEVVPHQHQGLHAAAVALAQGLHQFGVLFLPFGVEPLLELVQDEQHLLPSWQPLSTAESCQGPLQASPSAGTAGQRFPQARQQPGLGFDLPWPPRRPAGRARASRGSKPAFTSEDLPQPDGP